MPSSDDYAAGPRDAMLRRLAQTPEDLRRLIGICDAAVLVRRPEPKSWSATEIVCHLRDVEELFQVRFLEAGEIAGNFRLTAASHATRPMSPAL